MKSESINLRIGQITASILGTVLCGGTIAGAQTPAASFKPDVNTLFLHHFEKSLDADEAAGSSRVAGHTALGEGRFGSGARLERGLMESPQGLVLPFVPLILDTAGNIDARRGTLEFWVRPDLTPLNKRDFGTLYYLLDCWQGHGFRIILRDDLKGNRDLLISEKPVGDAKAWEIVGSVKEWQPASWHHVALIWDGKYRALFVDGKLLKEAESPNSELPVAETMWLGSTTYQTWLAQSSVDEFRISDIARYGERGKTALPVAATDFKNSNGNSPFRSSGANGISGTVRWRNETANSQNVEVKVEQTVTDGVKRHRIRLHNTAATPQNLRLWVETPFRASGEWHFWDGRAVRKGMAGRVMEQDEIMNTFPLACAYDNANGVALGLEAGQIRSWFGSAMADGMLRFQTKVALAPGETDTVEFVSFPFTPSYAYRSAVQRYQDAFPQWFHAANDIDPRLLTGCMTGASWYVAPSLDNPGPPVFSPAEIGRRARTQWEWCYAPFKYAGDLKVRPEWWSLIPTPQKATAEHRAPTPEPFLKKRQDRFDAVARWNIAPTFYYINWVNEVLGEEYKDSLIKADDVFDARGIKISPWVQSYSTDLRASWWGTNLEANTKADMKELIEKLPLSGFAHDVAVGGSRYRGAGLWKTPGRSYDERGAYAEEGTGIALMFDYVHSLKRGKWRMGNVANNTPCTYPIAFRADNTIYEGRADEALVRDAELERTRLLHGSRPRSLYTHNYGLKYGSRFDASKMSDAEVREMGRRMWDYSFLFCLRDGYVLAPDFAFGYERTARMAKLLAELAATGWQPVPAMRAEQPLWLTRYGKGAETRLVMINPREKSIQTTVRIEQAQLDGEQNVSYLFADEGDGKGGAALLQQLTDGVTTLTVNLPPRGALIVRAVAQLPRTARWSGNVGQQWNTDGGEITVSNAPQAIRFIGKADFVPASGGKFRSRWLQASEKEWFAFPWQQAKIVLPKNANEQQRWAAWRVQEYFRFWDAAVNKAKKPLMLPIAETVAANEPAIVLREGSNAGAAIRGSQVILTSSGEGWPNFLDTVLDSLDARYPFVGDWSVYMSTINAAVANKDPEMGPLLKRMGFPGPPLKEAPATP